DGAVVVVDMRFLGVLGRFIVQAVIVAVLQRRMVVLVGMPRRAVVPLTQKAALVVMGDMVVVMAMHRGRMQMTGLVAFALDVLGHLAGRACCLRAGAGCSRLRLGDAALGGAAFGVSGCRHGACLLGSQPGIGLLAPR